MIKFTKLTTIPTFLLKLSIRMWGIWIDKFNFDEDFPFGESLKHSIINFCFIFFKLKNLAFLSHFRDCKHSKRDLLFKFRDKRQSKLMILKSRVRRRLNHQPFPNITYQTIESVNTKLQNSIVEVSERRKSNFALFPN